MGYNQSDFQQIRYCQVLQIKYKRFVHNFIPIKITLKIENMDSQAYSNRLKQIRQKYNTAIKNNYVNQNTSQQTYKPQNSRPSSAYNTNLQTRSRQFSQNHVNPIRNNDDVRTHRKEENSQYNPESRTYRKCQVYEDDFTRQEANWLSKKYDDQIFVSSKKRQQRMQQIQEIRKSFAQSRKKTIQDFTKDRLRKSNKRLQTRPNQQTFGLRERINTITDPLQNRFAQKRQILIKEYQKQSRETPKLNFDYNNRIPLDRAQNRQNIYNYDSFRNNLTTLKSEILQSPSKYRSNKNEYKIQSLNNVKPFQRQKFQRQSLSKFDRQNINVVTSIIRQFQGPNIKYQSGSTSPIKGLRSLELSQKARVQRNWNPSNIDRIQERIQSILGKK